MPTPRPRTALAAVLLASLSSCKALWEQGGLERPSADGGARRQAVPNPPLGPNAVVQDPLTSILRYEAARSDGEGFLQFQLAQGDEPVRTRAATALGRLAFPEFAGSVTSALVGALDDASPRVRAAAAFALGERGDPSSAAALVARLKTDETDASVRALLVEAASRIDDPRTHAAVLAALGDVDARVRQEAWIGPSRWKTDAADAGKVDSELVLRAGEVQLAKDAECLWRASFTLGRRKCAGARELFHAGLAHLDPRVRLMAAQGLGSLGADAGSARKLAAALGDHDWRVVCEALVALGKHPDAQALDALAALVEHPSAHVRRALFEALGSFADARERVLPLIEKARVDTSANVRAAAIVAGAKLVHDEAAPDLELRRIDKDALIRAGAAAAAAELSDALAVPLLLALSRDADLRVAGLAIEGLGKHATEPARARLLELVESGDNGLALGAVEALREGSRESDLAALEACWRRASGDIAAELKAGLLENAAKIGSERAGALIALGVADPERFVNAKARKLDHERFHDRAASARRDPTRRRTQVADVHAFASNPRVEVLTTRGSMVFELFPDEAPLHVHNFLELARSGYYANLLFHRVVPDFVVQGGDYRGDGNGGKTWDAAPLPAEFTPRKFVRGSLGMPRNEDPDSGGSQIFVTHRETPHLDGRYTLFGQLVSGQDVLDAIEVGDRIREVRILDARPQH